MLLPKEFYCVGNSVKKQCFLDYFYILAGVLGSLILLYGLFQEPNAQFYYIIGSAFLLSTAIYYKLFYFIALEIILVSGHAAILLGIGTILQTALPVLLCIQLFFYYLLSGQLRNIFLLIGIIGIALFSVSFAYANQWIFFLGSLAIAVYAFYCVFRGKKIAWLWGILNLLFATVAVFKLLIH